MQWIVDGYSLAFAALVLARGSLGDRYGRRPTLLIGLVGFASSSVAAGLSTSVGELIAWPVIGAALAVAHAAGPANVKLTDADRHPSGRRPRGQ